MREYKDVCIDHYVWTDYSNKIFTTRVDFVPNKYEYEFKRRFYEKFPIEVVNKFSKLPVVGNPGVRKQTDLLLKA